MGCHSAGMPSSPLINVNNALTQGLFSDLNSPSFPRRHRQLPSLRGLVDYFMLLFFTALTYIFFSCLDSLVQSGFITRSDTDENLKLLSVSRHMSTLPYGDDNSSSNVSDSYHISNIHPIAIPRTSHDVDYDRYLIAENSRFSPVGSETSDDFNQNTETPVVFDTQHPLDSNRIMSI